MIRPPCGAMTNLIEGFNCKYCIISIRPYWWFGSAEIRSYTLSRLTLTWEGLKTRILSCLIKCIFKVVILRGTSFEGLWKLFIIENKYGGVWWKGFWVFMRRETWIAVIFISSILMVTGWLDDSMFTKWRIGLIGERKKERKKERWRSWFSWLLDNLQNK